MKKLWLGLKKYWQSILISLASGAIAGLICWLSSGKGRSSLANWLSAIGTIGAVIVSLYLSAKSDRRQKEEKISLHLPYFRIDEIKSIKVPLIENINIGQYIDDRRIIEIINSLKDKLKLGITIVNIDEVKTLLEFKLVVRLSLITKKNNKAVSLGSIYCAPILENSAMLKQSEYSLELLGTKEEQIEQLKKCYFVNKINYDSKIIDDECKKYLQSRLKNEQLATIPISFKDYMNEIEYGIINSKFFPDFLNDYELCFSDIYVSCKTVMDTEIFYKYSNVLGETYYRNDRRKIYAGTIIDELELANERKAVLEFFENNRTIINDKDKKIAENNKSNEQLLKQKCWKEYLILHNELNKIRNKNNAREFDLKEICNGWDFH